MVPGSSPGPPTKTRKEMKEKSEERTGAAVKLLLETLERNSADVGLVLDEYEATHDDAECEQSRQYQALVAGQSALKEAIDKINYQLNK